MYRQRLRWNFIITAYSGDDTLKWCDIVSIDAFEGDIFPIICDFEGYTYAQDDYLRVFAITGDGSLKLLTVAQTSEISG